MHAPDVTATRESSGTERDRRSASLDGLRGIAALTVFAFHGWLYTMPAPDASDRPTLADRAAHELRLGLVLFFVLSGFLVSRPWFAAALERRRAPDLRRYVRARAARIGPAYYLALVGSIALLWGLAGTPGVRLPPARELPLFFVFGQNFSSASVMKLNPPTWTLVVELSFYALLPLLGWLALRLPARRRAQALVPLGVLALGLLYNWAIAGRGLGMTFSKTLPAMAPYFALGMLAAVVAHRRTIGPRLKHALVAGGCALILTDAALKAGDPQPYFLILRDLPSAAGCALIVAAFATATAPSRVVGGRLLAGLGRISYGFYLWHVPVLVFLRGHGLLPLDPLLGPAVALAPTLAISVLSWIAIERRVIAWAAARDDRTSEALRDSSDRRASGAAGGREVSTVRA